MAQLSRHLRSVGGGGLTFWCQGCKEAHTVWVGDGPGPRWGWNGNVEQPVFTPSVLVTSHAATPPVTADNLDEWKAKPWPQTKVERRCHTFVGCNGAQPGEIIFLGDCTHELAGKTLPLADLPPHMSRVFE